VARARLSFLSEQEEDLIHSQSLRLLNEMGVLVRSESVLQLLESKGAIVDFGAMTAKMPAEMIEAALDTAPKEVALCGRDPRNDLRLPATNYPYSVNNGLSVFVVDKDTGEYRDCNSDDLAEFMRLTDALDGVDFVWPALAAKDKPAHAQTLYELWITLQNTSKHVQGDAIHGAHNARAQIELASLIVGGEAELRQRPIFSVTCCPLAPLSFETGSIEAQVELARGGIPISSMSMSLSGLSAPVTVAGTLTNANAENLASLVITQAASPGAPHIYASDSTPMNMATGNIDYAAPEYALIASGLAQMARRYRLPSLVSGFTAMNTGSKDGEAYCRLILGILGSAAVTDITGGLGSIDDAKGVCFAQLLLDAYAWELSREYLKPVEITEQTIGLEVMKEIGHTGSYLTHRHTAKNMRKALIMWDVEKLALLSMERKALIREAGNEVRRILAVHQALPVDEDVVRKGYEIISAYEERYAA
jgi:trimethylamine--corrinoid protein Co-methyltransferase